MPDLFIDGEWTGAADGGVREIHCPADGQLVRTVDEAGSADTERAIAAARRAFDDDRWFGVDVRDRAALLNRVADLLERDAEEIARTESLDTGKRIVESRYDVGDVVRCFRYFADAGPRALLDRPVEIGRAHV